MVQSHQHGYKLEEPWKVGAVILGAGRGERLGYGPKALIDLAGKPLLRHVLDAIAENETVSAISITAPHHLVEMFERIVVDAESAVPVTVLPGGPTRQTSAATGAASLPAALDWIAVTDVARPFTPQGIIDRLLRSLRVAAERSATTFRPCGVVPVLPLADSVHVVGDDSLITEKVERSSLRAAQTPQVFFRECLERAYEEAGAKAQQYTDEAGMVSCSGGAVVGVPGDFGNFKVTFPNDLIHAHAVLSPSATVAAHGRLV
jgi:2-C-methyl-D-erythritol 4-phosphate cytidylyltransferase